MTEQTDKTTSVTFRVDGKDEWRWSLRAENDETIADSGKGYKRVADCMHDFELATGAVIERELQRVAVRVITSYPGVVKPGVVMTLVEHGTVQVAQAIEVKGLAS